MAVEKEVPRGTPRGFIQYMSADILSGFLVFLIALPLCLGISLASGYPPLAGVFTAIIGAIVTTFISNSELTIKGPAAGLIVIAIGCIEDFGGDGAVGGFLTGDMTAYKLALAVGVAAAVMQIIFGLSRAGILGEFFPISTVHGMLAAIGVIIIAKQLPVVLGVTAKGGPLQLLKEIPHFIMQANPAIAAIGVTSLAIMFIWPLLYKRVPFLNRIPAPLVVLLVSIPLGSFFDLIHPHSYTLQGHQYQLSDQYLVSMPARAFGMFDEIAFPDFSALQQAKGWKWAFMFFIIGSLESLLSAKAIDLIDPWKRKTSMDRDVVAIGVANLCAAMVGGLPMISEIVRSRANIDNGAKTRFADLWHGLFLLICVALIPTILHRIPLAALAAMLVYTGFRLAHPTEFVNVYKIGREQLIIFATTLIAVLATDLLIGIGVGIAMKFLIHVINGVPLESFFKAKVEVIDIDKNTTRIKPKNAAVFSNWLALQSRIHKAGLARKRNLVIDLSETDLVDHTVMDKLLETRQDFQQEGLSFEITGLDAHRPFSPSHNSARKRLEAGIRRITVVTDAQLEDRLAMGFVGLGATGYTSVACSGIGRRLIEAGAPSRDSLVRMELIVTPKIEEKIIRFLKQEIDPQHPMTVCVENVNVLDLNDFVPNGDSSNALGQGEELEHAH